MTKGMPEIMFSISLFFFFFCKKSVSTNLIGHRYYIPDSIHLLKVNNGNSRTMCEIFLKLIIKTREWRQWRRSDVFIVNFE